MSVPFQSRPERSSKDPFRSIDEFLDEAHRVSFSSDNNNNNNNNEVVEEENRKKRFMFLRSTKVFHHWMMFLALGIANSGDSTEISAMNYVLSNNEFQRTILNGGDYSHRGAAIASSIFGGMLLGGILTGSLLGDRWGRRPTLILGLFLNTVSGIGSALSWNASILCWFRFCSGLGIGAVLSSLLTLTTELSPSKHHRGWYVTFVSGFWTLGSVFIAAIAFILYGKRSNHNDNDNHDDDDDDERISWRIFALIAASPCALGGIMVYILVPESPRFLALNGRYQEALNVVNRLANNLGYRGPPFEMEELQHQYPILSSNRFHQHHHQQQQPRINKEEDHDNNHHDQERKVISKKKKKSSFFVRTQLVPLLFLRRLLSWNQSSILLNNNNNHRRQAWNKIIRLYQSDLLWTSTIPLQFIWFTMSFGSGMCTWITKIFDQINNNNNNDDKYLSSLYFALANLPGILIAIWIMDRIGRKILLLSTMILCSISLFVLYILIGENNDDNDIDISNTPSETSTIISQQQYQYRALFIILMACIFSTLLVLCWSTLSCISSELFPTNVRSTGMGICGASGRIAAMMVQYINGAWIDAKRPDLLILTSSLMIGFGCFGFGILFSTMKDMAQLALDDDNNDDDDDDVDEEDEENVMLMMSSSIPNKTTTSSSTRR